MLSAAQSPQNRCNFRTAEGVTQLPSLFSIKHRHARCTQTARGLPFDPPPFKPSKLKIAFDLEAEHPTPAHLPILERRYTLTHNDITGSLLLTVGRRFSALQLSGWYSQLLRDEVLAEWVVHDSGAPQLHIYCHVSGQERWLAPPQLRNYIFKREMPLVLDTFAWTERELLAVKAEFSEAPVFVHFTSNVQDLNCTLYWGRLGFRDSWRRTPTSILQRILGSLPGIPGIKARSGMDSGSSSSSNISVSQTAPATSVSTSIGSRPGGDSSNRSSTSSSTCSSRNSISWRHRFLARLDDSIDGEEFDAFDALNDPCSNLKGIGIIQTDACKSDAWAVSPVAAPGTQLPSESSAAASAIEASNLPLQQANTEIAAVAFEEATRQSSSLWLPPDTTAGTADTSTDMSHVATDGSSRMISSQSSAAHDCQQQQRDESLSAVDSHDQSDLCSDVGYSGRSSSSFDNAFAVWETGAVVQTAKNSDSGEAYQWQSPSGASRGNSSTSSNTDSSSPTCNGSFNNNSRRQASGVSVVKDPHKFSSGSSEHHISSTRHALRGSMNNLHDMCTRWPNSSENPAVACSASFDEH